MCGFFGLFSFKNNPIKYENQVKYGLNFIKSRGPDASLCVSEGFFFIGHNRLRIQDLNNSADQPFYSKCRNYVIVFNGEIYNYLELKNKYLKNKIFKTTSDTEVLLELLITFKERIIKELIGMFSFVFIDIGKKKVLFGRDHYGIKPLYYLKEDNGNLWFASEPKCFKSYKNARLRNLQKYIDYSMGVLMDETEETYFSKIKQVPPGYFGTFCHSNFFMEKYTSPMFSLYENEYKFNNFEEILSKSVKRHLISDVDSCLFFSGGVDSSILVPFLKEYLENTSLVTAISIKDKLEDIKYINKLLDIYGLSTFFLKCDNFQEEYPSFQKMMDIYDEPFNFGSNTDYYLCNYAKENNFKVVIEGQGGDELFWGYERYTTFFLENLFLKGNFNMINKLISDSQFNNSNTFKTLIFKHSKYLRKLKNHFNPLLQYRYARQEKLIKDHQTNIITNSNIDYDLQEIYNFRQWDIDSKLLRILRFKDRISMHHSIELRTPFLDQELFESFKLKSIFSILNNATQKEFSRKLFKNQYGNIEIYNKNSFLKGSNRNIPLQKCVDKEFLIDLKISSRKMFKTFFGNDKIKSIDKILVKYPKIYNRALIASAHYYSE